MQAPTIIAYLTTFIALFFSITSIPQAIIGGLAGRYTGPLFGMLLGSVIAWQLINILWVSFEGGQIPVVVLVSSLLFILTHGFIAKNELTQQSNWMMAAEMWGIILVGIFINIYADSIRWY
jgi:hypothetical protein